MTIRHYRCQRDILLHMVGMLVWNLDQWNNTPDDGVWLCPGTIISVVRHVQIPNENNGLLWQVVVGDVVGWVFAQAPEYRNGYYRELEWHEAL